MSLVRRRDRGSSRRTRANWLGFASAAKAIAPQGLHGALAAPGARAPPPPMSPISAPATRPTRPRRSPSWARLYAMQRDLAARRSTPIAASLAARRRRRPLRKTYEELREEHGFRITDYKVDSDSASPRVCFQLLRSAGARQGRFRALRRRFRRGQRRRHGRGAAALRRRPEARRALRHRAAPGPAVGCRREPAEVGRLRDLRPRPLAAGALHRQATTCCRAPARRASRSSRSTPPRSPSRSSASATATCLPTVRSEDFLGQLGALRGRASSPTRRA